MPIEAALTALAWLLSALAAAPMLMIGIEAAAALAGGRGGIIRPRANASPDTVVLIPAHNEESVIGRCLTSLASGLPRNCRLLCVAHNCTDASAELARRMGAEAIEVRDAGTGGKPDALMAGLRWLDANPPDVVVIVDADCVAAEGAIETLAARAWEQNRPVMAAYFFAPADAGNGLATLSSLAVLLKNFVRPLGLHRLGLPCLLNGSGSAYPFQLIRNAPHGKGSIAEDYQLTIDLLRKGYPTLFVPEARVDGQLPASDGIALRQRRRWEHGHLILAFRTAPRLLLEGLLRLDKNRIALALELGVPPLAFLGLIWLLAAMLSAALLVFQDNRAPLVFLLAAAAAFALAVLLSWMRFAGVRQTLGGFAMLPRYLLWKLPMYRDFFIRRETRWMKTGRD